MYLCPGERNNTALATGTPNLFVQRNTEHVWITSGSNIDQHPSSDSQAVSAGRTLCSWEEGLEAQVLLPAHVFGFGELDMTVCRREVLVWFGHPLSSV